MKKLLLLLSVLFFALDLSANQYNADNIEMVHLKDRSRYVCNPDNVLSWESVAHMDALLANLEDSTGIETVVVAVDSLENGDCYETALRIGQKYGVGKESLSNGLVILLSTNERCVQFSTGNGLEGYLPDVICKRIQRDYMVPYFSEGNWNDGMVKGVEAVYGTLQGSMKWEHEDEETSPFSIVIVLLICFAAPIFSVVNWWCEKKCPNCGKHKLKCVASTKVYSDSSMVKYQDTLWCNSCGHEKTRLRTIYKSSNTTRRSGGFGGGFGGGFSGGSSGGSFGGGSFGGGGAGSRF